MTGSPAGAPNRYRLPAFYELHVWAWRHNPNDMFAGWNPNVSCDKYAVNAGMGDAAMAHGSGH